MQNIRTGKISPSGVIFPLTAITESVRSGKREANSSAMFAPSLNPKRIHDGIRRTSRSAAASFAISAVVNSASALSGLIRERPWARLSIRITR